MWTVKKADTTQFACSKLHEARTLNLGTRVMGGGGGTETSACFSSQASTGRQRDMG